MVEALLVQDPVQKPADRERKWGPAAVRVAELRVVPVRVVEALLAQDPVQKLVARERKWGPAAVRVVELRVVDLMAAEVQAVQRLKPVILQAPGKFVLNNRQEMVQSLPRFGARTLF